VLPSLSIVGIGVIVAASIIKHKMDNVWYLIVFAIIMLLGYLVMLLNERKAKAGTTEAIE
jgi:general stress protein CsbA